MLCYSNETDNKLTIAIQN